MAWNTSINSILCKIPKLYVVLNKETYELGKYIKNVIYDSNNITLKSECNVYTYGFITLVITILL